MKEFFRSIGHLLHFFWQGLSVCRRLVANLLFLALVVLLVLLLFVESEPKFPTGAALILAPAGKIVEQRSASVLSNGIFRDAPAQETVLKDIIDVIDYAKNDRRIKLLVLDLKDMHATGISKLNSIGAALARFKSGGKKIIAAADYYTQPQYYLATYADRIFLDPMGGILLEGYGLYRKYFENALQKLKIRFHVFRVGTYKSALEPFMRNDMSAPAKQANLAWLTVLWRAYTRGVALRRGLAPGTIDEYVNNIAANLATVQGDTARLALKFDLVDALKTREQVRRELIQRVGLDKDTKTYKQVAFEDYLDAIRPELLKSNRDKDQVGVIVARGVILDGTQPPGRIGGDSMAKLIRRAREDKKIKALVLRIDSGGGSAFASEIIRRQVELTRRAGKPVIASLGSVAASGGYWMAVAADQIWALPTTLTGSIGIFGAFATFESSLKALGISTDGVGTTRLADGLDPSRPLNPQVADAMQQMIERGYRRFINQVARGRKMTPAKVEKIAEGRVWAGKTALALGLVDRLGGLQEAIRGAAKQAGLQHYRVTYVKQPLSARQKLLRGLRRLIASHFGGRFDAATNPAVRLYRALGRPVQQILQFNDPYGLYAYCPVCEVP